MAPWWVWLLVLLGALTAALAIAAWWLVRGQDDATRALAGRVGRLPWRSKGRLA